jgi:hypothetical protein
VDLYFPLEKKLGPRFHVKESEWKVDLGNWTQVRWNQEKLIPRQWHSQECEKVEPMSWQD